jgi:hypothetical protein
MNRREAGLLLSYVGASITLAALTGNAIAATGGGIVAPLFAHYGEEPAHRVYDSLRHLLD